MGPGVPQTTSVVTGHRTGRGGSEEGAAKPSHRGQPLARHERRSLVKRRAPNIVPPNAEVISRGHNPRSQCNLLAAPEYTSNVLVEAGWSAIERTTYRQTMIVEREALLDDDAHLGDYGVGKDRLAEARGLRTALGSVAA